MSVPVAGRRKGVNPSASPSPPPQTSAEPSGGPSWLDDLDASPAHSPPLPVPATQAPVATSGAASREHDPLAFLSDGDAGGGGVAFNTAPATSLPWLDDAVPPAATRTIPAHRTAVAVPMMSPSGSPTAVPAFLQSDTEAVYGTSLMAGSPAPSSPMPPAAMIDARQAERAREQAQRAALQQQLSELDRQLREAARGVEELQGSSHPLAAELTELESTLASLRAQEAAARQKKMDRETAAAAAAEEAARATAAAAAASEDGKTVADAESEFRRECVRRSEGEVDRLTTAVQAQQERNAALQSEWEASVAHDTDDSRQSAVLETLLQRIRDGARHFKRHMAVQCGSVVAASARTHLAAARRQRTDIFASDAAARAQTLAEHQARREADAAAFHDECRQSFQARADSAFGAIRVAVEAAHRQQYAEQSQRVAAFQTQLAGATERQREALEHQLRHRVEQEHGIMATHRDTAARELASRLEELSAQRRTFRLRAVAELNALRESRGESHALGGRHVPSSVPTSASPGASQEVLHANMDRVRAKMEQLAVSLRTKCLGEQAETRPQSATAAAVARGLCAVDWSTLSDGHLRSGTPGPAPAPTQMEENWHNAVLALQHNRDALRRGIAKLGEATRHGAGQLHQQHTQITRHREDVKGVRTEWEQSIRSQLARCFTAAGAEVPPVVSLTTNTLLNLRERVTSMAQAQQSLRATRTTFTDELSKWAESLTGYRAESERLLRDIFVELELLRGRSVEAEVDQLTLQSVQAQVDVLEHHVTEGASRLALRKRYIDTAVQELRAGALTAHDSAGELRGGAQRTKGAASTWSADAAARGHAIAVVAAPPAQASAVTVARSASSVTAPSAVARAAGSSGIVCSGGGGLKNASAMMSLRATTSGSTELMETLPVPAAGNALPSSGSPSPVVPPLHGSGGWPAVRAENAGGVGAGAGVLTTPSAREASTASPAVVPSEAEPGSYREDDPDFSTDLVPLDDDDDDSFFDPLFCYTR